MKSGERPIMPHVVKFRDRAHAALQPRMGRDVFDALAVQPDLSLLLPQASDVLLSGSRWHSGSPSLRVWKTSRTHPGSHLVPAFTAEFTEDRRGASRDRPNARPGPSPMG